MVVTSIVAQSNIENKEIVIYGDREIVLPEVERNYEKINFDVPRENYPPQKYTFTKGDLPTIPEMNSKVKILPVKEPVIDKLYPYFVKLGMGNYATPIFELGLSNKRNQKYMYVAHYKHLSSARGSVQKSFSGTSCNEFELTTKYYSNNYTILADFDYKRRMNKFYGFDTQNEKRDKDTIKQVYAEPSFRFGANYKSKDSLLNATFLGTYDGIYTRKKSHENDFGYSFLGDYILSKVKLPGKVFLLSDLSILNKEDINKQKRYLFKFNPSYEYLVKGFRLEAGFGLAAENDTSEYSKNIHLYPLLKVNTVPLKGLGVYAEISGNMQKNSLKSSSYENQFIDKNVTIFHTNQKIQLILGSNVSVVKNLFFNLNGKYQNLANLPFFINKGVDSSRFMITYDSTGKTSLSQLNFGITYELATYTSSLQLELNKYHLGDGRIAMHRPSGIIKSTHSYNHRKKVYLDVNLWYMWGIKTYSTSINPKEIELNPIFDVSLGIKYKVNSKVGVFLDVNNILAQKYQRYLHYKNQGINFMLGAYASF